MTMLDSETSCDHRPEQGVDRPGLAVVINGATPYNVNLCRRLVHELPELKLHSIFTINERIWSLEFPDEINPAYFDDEQKDRRGKWARLRWRDFLTAGRIFKHLRAKHDPRGRVGGHGEPAALATH